MSRKTLVFVFAILVVTLVAGCSAPAPAPVPPTKTPKPTFTPTPDWTPTSIAYPTTAPQVQPTGAPAEATTEPESTAAAEATVGPTEAPTEAAPAVTRFTANQNVNVRSGPGTVYPAIGRLTAGQSFDVTGRNDSGDWVKFDYSGKDGWVTFALVSLEGDLNGVEIAQAPAVPTARPQPTARPRPAQQPQPQPQPTSPPAPPPVASKPWTLVPGSPISAPQCGAPYFKGQVQYKDGSPQNGVCLVVDRYGPRQIKYSGSDGSAGNWGFTPCGQENCGEIKIYVIECPPGVDSAGLSVGPGVNISAPLSDVFAVNVTDKCTVGQWENIIFRNTQQ